MNLTKRIIYEAIIVNVSQKGCLTSLKSQAKAREAQIPLPHLFLSVYFLLYH